MPFYFTENAEKDLWNHISFFENHHNCKKLLSGEFSSKRKIRYIGNTLDEKASQISMCIRQAKEYYYAYENTSINTSPLLLFYGMLSLSKALIIANNEDTFLDSSELMAHGISSKIKNQESLTNQNLKVKEKGTFVSLAKTISNVVFVNNTIINFKDLLSIKPEISEIYELYFNEPSHVIRLIGMDVKSVEPFDVELYPYETNLEIIYQKISNLKNDFDVKEFSYKHYKGIFGTEPEKKHIFQSKNMDKPSEEYSYEKIQHGGQYLVDGIKYCNEGTSLKIYIDPSISDYLIIYILSDYVRYKQVDWNSIISGGDTGILGLINIYLSSCKRRFPNLILNELYGEKFIFGTVGYIG